MTFYGRDLLIFCSRRFWRFMKSAKNIILIALVIVFSSFFIALAIFDYQHNHIVYHYMQKDEDLGLISATFFRNSKSYPNNTLILLFVAHQVFHMKHQYLQISYRNSSKIDNNRAFLRIEPVVQPIPYYCQWIPFIAIGQLNDHRDDIQLISGDAQVKLPIRDPFHESHDVVVCFSPLFLYERWQLLILSTQVYSYYGAFMHFYIRSIIPELYEMIKFYKRSRVSSWPGIRLGNQSASPQDFRVDLELEFRNQAAAMTDCLLLYKESAQYMIFPDTDDLIIPQLGRTYLEEFDKLFSWFPKAATIVYNSSRMEIHSNTSPYKYSVGNTLKSLSFDDQDHFGWGKVVARPDRIDSVWIHSSFGIHKDYEQINLSPRLNCVLHLRNWKFNEEANKTTKVMPPYEPLFDETHRKQRPLINLRDLEAIEHNFLKMIEQTMKTYLSLRETSLYYSIMEQCYNRILYDGKSHSRCLGPEACNFPTIPGFKCVNAAGSVESFQGNNIFIHLQKNWTLENSSNGCFV